ncbi:MAG: hypothetical protein J6K99_07230 [Peptococcaceae bacterium]|nr:hypothetical protein [Peptococcaceae bacterium]
MQIKTEPEQIRKEYEDDRSYKSGLELYDNVKRNNNFYHGRQWEGLNAPAIEKPVFNVVKPSVNYLTSMLVTDDIGVKCEFTNNNEASQRYLEKILQKEVAYVFEQNNIGYQNRDSITACAIDGDTVRYHYWDNSIQTGHAYTGGIRTERLDNTSIVFGNRSTNDIQSQPWLILLIPTPTDEVREMAKANGITDLDSIRPDDELQSNYNSEHTQDESKTTTVMLKFWKKDGFVHYLKTTPRAIVQPETRTNMQLYPISYFSWERVKHCCHGTSPVTAIIPNQIYINKIMALAMEYNKRMAFPKVVYDRSKLPGGWNNDVTRAVAVNGNPRDAVFDVFSAAPVNGQALELIESTITKTKDSLGVYDAALGNAKPDNTSAIVALQRASSQPLELQRMDFYKFIEDSVRIIIDMMGAYYGLRETEIIDENTGHPIRIRYDYNQLQSANLNLTVEIGQATYWSELAQMQTLDNLLAQGIIDVELYMEFMPDGYIPGKENIIKKIKERQAMMQQQQMAAAPTSTPTQQRPLQEMAQAMQMPMM